MTKILALILGVFIVPILSASAATHVLGEYLVQFRDQHAIPQDLTQLSGELGGASIEFIIPERNIAVIRPEKSSFANGDVLDRLKARRDVVSYQPNFLYRTALFLDHRIFAKQGASASPHCLFFSVPFAQDDQSAAAKPGVKPAPKPGTGADPFLGEDRDLVLANVPGAWEKTHGDRKVVVAVIDTGVDYNHEDLAPNMWHDPAHPEIVGWDFVDHDALPYDVTKTIDPFSGGGNPGHGTHCAGNVGAVGNNRVGTSGVAPQVSIMALRMLSGDGSGDTVAAIKSIDWAVKNEAQIISASWGSEGESEGDDLLKEAIARAASKNVLFVAAAGNTQPSDQKNADNDNSPKRRAFPASFDLPNIISVAASDQKGRMANFTHFGAKTVHLAAPGERSFSTVPSDRSSEDFLGGQFYEAEFDLPIFGKVPWNGTSMAAPQVAGAAALLLAKHPGWSFDKTKKRLLETVRPEPTLEGKTLTGGVLDVTKALAN